MKHGWMKKAFSMLLTAMMIVTAVPSSLRAEDGTEAGTRYEVAAISYDATTDAYFIGGKVKINDGDSGPWAVNSIEAGKEVTLYATPDPGFRFVGWYPEAGGAALSSDTEYTFTVEGIAVIHARFERFKATFNSRGGSAVDSVYVNDDGRISRPDDPSGPDFLSVFEDWYLDESFASRFDFASVLTRNTTLYARWNETIHLKVYDRSGGGNYSGGKVKFDSPASSWSYSKTELRLEGRLDNVCAAPEDGYRFIGWTIGSESAEILSTATEYEYMPVRGLTLYAVFELKVNCAVLFDPNGGTGLMEGPVQVKDSSYELPGCTFSAPDANHVFDHWQVKIGSADPVDKMPGETITLIDDAYVKAVWKDLSHSINIDDGIKYGSVSADMDRAKKDEIVSLSATADEGARFVKWLVTDANENTVEVREDNTFIMPDEDVNVSAEFGAQEKYELWVGQIQVDSLNKDDILNDGGKAKYDPASGTLTLDNPELDAGLEKAIHAKHLDLTIKGDLEATATNYGIQVEYGNLTIEEGNITLNVRDDEDVYGIEAGNTLSIKGGNITITGETSGAALCDASGLSGERVEISGGTVYIDVDSYHSRAIYSGLIFSAGTTVITGGDVTLISKGLYADGISASGLDMSGGKLHIECSSEDYSYGVNAGSATITISGGELTADCRGEGNYGSHGLHSEGGILISGGKINVSAVAPEYALGGANGISLWLDYYDSKKKIVINGGEIIASATGPDSTGIYTNQDLTISGGKIESSGEDIGIANERTMTIENGIQSVAASGGESGIYSIGGIVLGSDLTIKKPENGKLDEDGNTIVVGNEHSKDILIVNEKEYAITVAEDSQDYLEVEQDTANVGETIGIVLNSVPGFEIRGVSVTDSEGNEIEVSADNTFVMPASDVTVSAEVVQLFTLTFDLDGGTYEGQSTYTLEIAEGEVIEMPEPSKEGFIFCYWEGSKYYAGESYTVTENHSFKAIWRKESSPDSYVIPKTGIE